MDPTKNKANIMKRENYEQFIPVSTRWSDNDAYGHINNAAYYGFFDTAVNQYLIEKGVLSIGSGKVIGLVVESKCTYFSSLSYPGQIEVAIAVSHIGRSSVRYETAVFEVGKAVAAASGYFVHVYVDRASRQPLVIPEILRAALIPLLIDVET